MKHGICTSSLIAIALIGLGFGGLASAAEQAAAMVTRIEPSTGGSARVTGPGRAEEVAFMMPLYAGDELQVDSPKMSVQVKFFGGDEVMVQKGEPLRIEAPPEERGMLSSVMLAISDKVFRNNQVSRRNLVTRSEGDERPLTVFGIGADLPAQKLRAGTRALFIRWNLDLDRVAYRIDAASGGQSLAAGMAEGDFVFIEGLDLKAGADYRLVVESQDGRTAAGNIAAVAEAPPLTPAEPALGTIGQAISLLELGQTDDGQWKLEAIQGVVDLAPDDIDRATLIEEISAL